MKSCAIICEYNPFHNGHKYQIDKAKEMGFECVVSIMSGNLVQRGETAICDKFSRAKAALLSGADLVVELPSVFSVSAAETFANSGVIIADSLGCDTLIFGSECGDIQKISAISDNLLSGKIDSVIKKHLSSGVSFSAARQLAYTEVFGDCNELSNPNDILGFEYVSAIKRNKLNINPVCIKRTGPEHDSKSAEKEFASASYIRELIESGNLVEACKYMPSESAIILKENIMKGKISKRENIDKAILSKLRGFTANDFAKIPGLTDGLDFRIYNASRKATSVEELIALTKSKRHSMARIKRALMCSYFEIDSALQSMPISYIRVLGMNKQGEAFLRQRMSYETKIPIVIRPSNLIGDPIFDAECKISDLYSLSFEKPSLCGSELTSKFIKI